MSDTVFINTRGVVCKKANGKSICAFPDVCLSPPSPPAGPIPIPYPNTAMASDTSEGSKSVKIHGAEAILKNKSYFKKSTGDEPATKSFGMNVMSHQIQGKVYFTAWSMDVKIEGENAVRHLDIATHNHASTPPGTPPWPHMDKMNMPPNLKSCDEQKEDAESKCKGAPPAKGGKGLNCKKKPGCAKAQACILVPKDQDKKTCCAPNATGHHLVEVHVFTATGGRAEGNNLSGFKKYDPEKAPTVCASSSRFQGTHGIMHSIQGAIEAAFNAGGKVLKSWPGAGKLVKGGGGARGPATSKWSYKDARETGVMAHSQAFPHCNPDCTRKQLDDYHNKAGAKDSTPVRTDPVARTGGKLSKAQQSAVESVTAKIAGVGGF
jgi:hypothetical protein